MNHEMLTLTLNMIVPLMMIGIITNNASKAKMALIINIGMSFFPLANVTNWTIAQANMTKHIIIKHGNVLAVMKFMKSVSLMSSKTL